MKIPEGWTRDAQAGKCTYDAGTVHYEDNSVSPLSLCITPARARWGSVDTRQDVVEYRLTDGRYKAVLECFTHADDEAEARYYFLAVEELRKFDVQQMRDSPELEFQALQKALRLEWVDNFWLWHQMLIEAVPLYRAAMTLAQWEELIWYAMAYGCWEYWRNDDKPAAIGLGELVEEWTPTVVEMLKLAYPEHAGAIEVFRGQLIKNMPQFEMNAPAAKSYVHGMVKRAPQETFELPDLDA